MREVGLYVHIPFCKRKCSYCDFNSYENSQNEQIDLYIRALIKELKRYSEEYDLKYRTVFIGGGTPTFIHCNHIGQILAAAAPRIVKNAEVTIEANPGTLTRESLNSYRSFGINRLSIGLQAWQKEMLDAIGRIHSSEDFVRSIGLAREAGFENINADLMFALPGQTLKMWDETIRKVCSLGIEHISCYSLKLEEGTELCNRYNSKEINIPDEDEDRRMYHHAEELLKGYGLTQYEISNFSLPGFECRHNLIYWNNEEYVGVGAGSHSKLDGKRFWNYSDLELYIDEVNKGAYPVEESQIIGLKEEVWESILLALRLNKGIDLRAFNKIYNMDFLHAYKVQLKKLEDQGLVEVSERNLRLTEKGRDLSNQVFIEFM